MASDARAEYPAFFDESLSSLLDAYLARMVKRVLVVCSFYKQEANWNEEEGMERRGFLRALTAASLGVVLEGSLTGLARAQNAAASLPDRATKKSEFPENSTIVL